MAKLNKVAKMWVKELRSGKIKQTRNTLGRESGSRCCLGVLCDLAVKHKVISNYDMTARWLPFEVKKWAGLSSDVGKYTSKQGMWRHLVEDNDKAKYSFSKIADIIESQPEGLFE